MATVYSRPLRSGGVRWYTKQQQPDGTWKPVPLKGARNESQAWKLAVEMEAHNERLQHGLDGGMMFQGTFGELCTWAWDVHFKHLRGARSDSSRLEYHGGATVRTEPATRRGAKRAPDGWKSPLGPMPARRVTRHVLENYFDDLAKKNTPRGTPTSASSINRIRAVFSTVFELAKSRGKWAGDNPAELTHTRKQRHAEFSILTLDEIPRVLAATPDYWRGCFATGMLAALRKGEVFGLMKSDVDLERRQLLVRRSHGHDRTKGGDGKPEPVPIHPDLMPFIVDAMSSPGPYLFPDRDGKRRPERTKIERIFRAAMVRAGIVEGYDHKCRRKGCGHLETHPDAEARDCPRCDMKLWPVGRPRHIRFQDGTRHTLASQALMAGATLTAVQGILRHKDPRTTMKHYGHLAPSYLADELSLMTIPGLASARERRTAQATGGEPVEHTTPRRTNARTPAGRGASMVRADLVSVLGSSAGSRSGGKHAGLLVEPSGIEPLTCALRKRPADAPGPITPYQPVGTIGFAGPADSSAYHPEAPLFTDHGASMVRGSSNAHHDAALSIAPGFGDEPPVATPPPRALLTVRQVAALLQVSTACVYRQVEIGALGHCRVANAIRVSEADLAAYLARASSPGTARGKGGE